MALVPIDGVSDIVGVHWATGCMYLFSGNTNGTVGTPTFVSCGWQNYRNLEGPGDIDNDGIGDLVALRRSDGCAASWHGTRTGGFTYAGDHLCGRPDSNVMIGLGDLNGDDHGDVAGTDLVTTSMLTWFSNGAGAFIPSGQHFCCFGQFILT